MRNRRLSPRECSLLGLRYERPIRPLESVAGLKNGCGVLAVSKAWRLLRDEGIKSRILNLDNGAGAHAVLIYGAPDGTYFSFDEGGSIPLPGVTATSSAIAVARVFLNQMSRVTGKRVRDVVKATWETR